MEAQDIERPLHRISIDQFHLMVEAGVFTSEDRVELIDGEMRDMPPIGPAHGGCTIALTQWLVHAMGDRALVSVQGPLGLDDRTELYPDLLVLKRRDDLYRTAHPGADDVLLLIEVSDSTLHYDIHTKLPKYARAGVPLCWIADVRNKAIRAYWDPDRFGRRYRETRSVADGAMTATLAGVELSVTTAELFRY